MQGPETTTTAANVATFAQCFWVFATLGPAFGYATITALVAIEKADNVSDLLMVPLTVVIGAPFMIPFAMLMGLVPAILVGTVYWALRAKTSVRAPDAIALTALAGGVVCACAVVLFSGEPVALLDGLSWTTMIVPGIVAALLCAALIERRLKKAQARAGFT